MNRLELPNPSGQIQRAIQRTVDLVSFALQAADRAEVEALTIPGSHGNVAPAESAAMGVDQAREEFRVWAIANGLRDCIDAIGPALEWARKTCFLWTRGNAARNEEGNLSLSAKISGEDWNTHIVNEAKKFDYWPLRKKIEHLQDEYGFQPPSLVDAVLSISYARNCLTHRAGIVGPEDLKEGAPQHLRIKWSKPQIRILGRDGLRVVEPPTAVQEGEQVSLGFAEVIRDFELGKRISFTPAEFVEISTTFLFFALEIEQAINTLQERRESCSSRRME